MYHIGIVAPLSHHIEHLLWIFQRHVYLYPYVSNGKIYMKNSDDNVGISVSLSSIQFILPLHWFVRNNMACEEVMPSRAMSVILITSIIYIYYLFMSTMKVVLYYIALLVGDIIESRY